MKIKTPQNRKLHEIIARFHISLDVGWCRNLQSQYIGRTCFSSPYTPDQYQWYSWQLCGVKEGRKTNFPFFFSCHHIEHLSLDCISYRFIFQAQRRQSFDEKSMFYIFDVIITMKQIVQLIYHHSTVWFTFSKCFTIYNRFCPLQLRNLEIL